MFFNHHWNSWVSCFSPLSTEDTFYVQSNQLSREIQNFFGGTNEALNQVLGCTDWLLYPILKTKLFKTNFWQISLYFLSLTHFFNQLLEPIEVKFQCIIPVITLTVLSSPSLLYSLFLMQYFQVLESVSEDVGFNIEIKWICQQKVSKCTGAGLWLKLVIWHNNFL